MRTYTPKTLIHQLSQTIRQWLRMRIKVHSFQKNIHPWIFRLKVKHPRYLVHDNMKQVHLHTAWWIFTLLFVFDYHWLGISWLTALFYSLIEVLSYMFIFYSATFIYKKWVNRPLLLWSSLVLFIAVYTAFFISTGLDIFFYEGTGLRNAFSIVLNTILFCCIAVLFSHHHRSQELASRNILLENANKNLQIAALKQSINPHFIFNTLNNLNALIAMQDKNLPEFITKFSRLLRYSVDIEDQSSIDLEKEVECIKAYIDLTLMNRPETNDIDFFVEGDLSGKKIVPFVLTSLLENAIKHGDLKYNKNGFLHASIESLENNLNFYIKNTYKKNEKGDHTTSQGMALIKKQLDLHYQSDYKLDVSQTDDVYIVRLSIFSNKILSK